MAPLGLRGGIETDRARAGQKAGARRSRGLLGKLVPAGAVLAAAVVALVLVLGGSHAPRVLAPPLAGGPTPRGVPPPARRAPGGPVLPAPAEDEAHGTLLKTSMQGVP